MCNGLCIVMTGMVVHAVSGIGGRVYKCFDSHRMLFVLRPRADRSVSTLRR